MGIFDVAIVLPRSIVGGCLRDNQEVTLKVVQEDLLRDLVGGKEGRRGTKIRGMSRRESILVLERGRFKHTRQCLAHLDTNVLIEGIKSLNIYEDWSESWSWKHKADVREETKESS